MVAAVVTESVPLCYGTCCAQHAQCKSYTAVEGSDALHYIATCQDGGGEWPLFVPLRSQQEVQAA